MSTGDFGGLTFLVTGANSGIGRALVEALAERGGSVVLAARSEDRSRPVLEEIRRRHPGLDAQFLLRRRFRPEIGVAWIVGNHAWRSDEHGA